MGETFGGKKDYYGCLGADETFVEKSFFLGGVQYFCGMREDISLRISHKVHGLMFSQECTIKVPYALISIRVPMGCKLFVLEFAMYPVHS